MFQYVEQVASLDVEDDVLEPDAALSPVILDLAIGSAPEPMARCSGAIKPPSHRIEARSRMFLSSRTFPGQ
jgi:hypothetical protein